MILAHRTIAALADLGHQVEFLMSTQAAYTASLEMGKEYGSPTKFLASFSMEQQEKIQLHGFQDVGCAIASGSYLTDGMVIVPCSMTTIAAIAVGLGDNAIRRGADVVLKERRPLVLVPREAPFSTLHLENLHKLSLLGATIVPPIPAWYTQPKSLEDVENFIVGKVLDALGVKHALYPRWNGRHKGHKA